MSEFENFALILQHSIQAIQHGHSFAMQAFNIKKELANKTKEAAGLQKTINKAEAKMKTLINQAEEAKKAKDEAKERAEAAEAITKVLEAEKKEVEAKIADAQVELIAALATKNVEIKATDERAYNEGVVDVKEEYKKQVKQVAMKCRDRLHELVKEEIKKKDSSTEEWKIAMERSFNRMDNEAQQIGIRALLCQNKASATLFSVN
ncbi:protein WEAK CHLOROPLAST MOVEMENT UNDER BLUE LIGHT-like 2 [Camellia sinensis]|uniref:protein WEAK CHLOROPLAST MOVEMENT UNDER BLUE LIGHT-like 2 n=1 Tax=Camellia sinensis TaxID=4442 RepID=UPI00103686B7|nr:protein WEAK CHLOROPLAST MOVEMENT UNDER BLUE LIGHT-like 2 [Camellia sinensis]